MAETLRGMDTISGKEGKAYIQIDGRNEMLFFARSIEATVEKLKSEVKAIGRRWVGHKTTGLQGSGSMTLYYLSPLFREMLAEYSRSGKDIYFEMVIENDDPASSSGRQAVQLNNCNFDSLIIGKLDGDSDDALEEDIDFTFEGFSIIEAFQQL